METLVLPSALYGQIVAQAVTAYPAECCGLLIGSAQADGVWQVSGLAPSANLAAATRSDRFELDPQVRFDAMRRCQAEGREIVGHYHSHPDHPAAPSATDRAMAYEPELLWLIVHVASAPWRDHATAWRPTALNHPFTPVNLVFDPS